MSQETIEGLLKCLDEVIVRRERDYQRIDSEYKREDGTVLSKKYDEYQRRKKAVTERADRESVDCQLKLDELCGKVRSKQPALVDMKAGNLNGNGQLPRWITLGKYHVRYENLDFYVPKTFRFPFEKPMYIADDSQSELLHKVLLRLMYALPANKQEYYVFDPIGMGRSVWIFNQLFSNQKLFPQGKVMTTSAELKAALRDVSDYMGSLYSDFFNIGNDCPDWDSCNRRFHSQGSDEKMLPYKIFIFMDVPEEMDADCFAMFRKLMLHSAECGFLVLFSFNGTLLEGEDSKMRAQELQLRQLVDGSLPLHACLHDQPTDSLHIVFRVEDLQRQPAAMRMQCLCQLLKCRNLAVIVKHRRRRSRTHRRNISDYNIGHAALCKPLVKSKAARSDRTVTLFIPGCKRRKHNPVFQRHISDLNRFQYFFLHSICPS